MDFLKAEGHLCMTTAIKQFEMDLDASPSHDIETRLQIEPYSLKKSRSFQDDIPVENELKTSQQRDFELEEEVGPNEHTNENKEHKTNLIYGLDESPPWYLAVLLGMQHYLTMIGSTVAIPFIITPLLCMAEDDPSRSVIISTIIFVSGIETLIQTTLGIRLPIVQGGSFIFIVPTIVILTTYFPTCDQYNFSNMTREGRREVWQTRIREIQGDMMAVSLFQTFIGFTGLIGLLMTWITPLTIASTITLVGLSLVNVAATKAEGSWGIAILTIVLLIAFSQYLTEWGVPLPTYIKSVGFKMAPFKIFKLFPVLLAILVIWALCAILTYCSIFEAGSKARTDTKINVLHQAPWFYVPYPFQWGWPTVTVAGVFGMFASTISLTMESLGDYYACAELAGAPPPPKHAVNRGIGMEGIGCIIAGMFGSVSGVTSYTENIGAIRATKVASRSVIQTGAAIMIFFGVFGKFGGLFITLPDPVLGGLLIVMFSFITAVGLSNLQFINLNSSRNLFTLGFSLFVGLAIPNWLKSNPGVIQTGSLVFDKVLVVLFSTPMFVGGFIGLVLDNSIPGTPEERGLNVWKKLLQSGEGDAEGRVECTAYNLPMPLDTMFKKWSWCRHVPFSPTYVTMVMKDEYSKTIRFILQKLRWKQTAEETAKDSNHLSQASL